jgi:hypothetical protein
VGRFDFKEKTHYEISCQNCGILTGTPSKAEAFDSAREDHLLDCKMPREVIVLQRGWVDEGQPFEWHFLFGYPNE